MQSGRVVELPRRGNTWIREYPGPKDAPTVVLLHGLGATGLLNWFTSVDALSRNYNVVTMDHRGHGRGIKPARRFRLEDCADDVAVLIDELGIGSAILVGYSMGGPITQLTWYRHPEVVRGVVLCATSYRFGLPETPVARVGDLMGLGLRLTPGLVRQQVVKNLTGYTPRGRNAPQWVLDELHAHDPAAIVEATMAIRRFNSTDWIDGIDVPAASVITELDRLVPPRRQRKLAALTHGELFAIPGGHDVCVSNPSLFVPALTRAVASVARRSKP